MSECIIPEDAKQLTKAQCLIEDKENWCQGRFRKETLDGNLTFCAIGAVREAINSTATGNLERHLNKAAGELFGISDIVAVNDFRGHKEVMKCFDHAVRKLIKEANNK